MTYARGVNHVHCLSSIIVSYSIQKIFNIPLVSIFVVALVSLWGHAASNKRQSLSVIVVVGHHTIIHLTFASTKQHLIWYSNVYLVLSATARVYCCIIHFIHRTEWWTERACWQTRVIFQSFDVGWLLLHQPFCCSSYGYHGRRVVVYNSNTSISDVLRDEPEIYKVQSTIQWYQHQQSIG